MRRALFSFLWMSCSLLALSPAYGADDQYEQPPVEYSRREPDNSVSKLQARLDRGEIQFEFSDKSGYLQAVLTALHVPIESQMLVFSQTSMQRHCISPRTPRAVYFSDDAYVGFCQQGKVLELSAVDPQLGTVFYTLEQKQADQPRFQRQTDSCLACHSSSRTSNVPGHVIRSLFVNHSGQPLLSEGSFSVDYTTPLEQRWGGWYVTGTHGAQTHLGNLIVPGDKVSRPVANEPGQNITDLAEYFSSENYLSPHSDIVALMVFEYQTLVQNRITQANFSTRQALEYQISMNRALGEPEGMPLESVTRRIESAGDALVEALLLTDEAQLTSPIRGTSRFAEQFAKAGPRDRLGRSLRDFDLVSRLFKYPCSYLIYSKAFCELPHEVRSYVWQRLWTVLCDDGELEPFTHLSRQDREAIIDIIRDTVPNLPEYWKEPQSRGATP